MIDIKGIRMGNIVDIRWYSIKNEYMLALSACLNLNM